MAEGSEDKPKRKVKGYEGRGKTAHLGLEVVPVPGGLYSIKNKGGGQAPANMKGLFTSQTVAHNLVKEYNESKGKE